MSRFDFLLGGLNIQGMGAMVDYSAPEGLAEHRGLGHHQSSWGRVLVALVEMSDGGPTHFTPASGRSSPLDCIPGGRGGGPPFGRAPTETRESGTTSASATTRRSRCTWPIRLWCMSEWDVDEKLELFLCTRDCGRARSGCAEASGGGAVSCTSRRSQRDNCGRRAPRPASTRQWRSRRRSADAGLRTWTCRSGRSAAWPRAERAGWRVFGGVVPRAASVVSSMSSAWTGAEAAKQRRGRSTRRC